MKREQKGAWLAAARLTALGLAITLAGSALGQSSKPAGGQCDWGTVTGLNDDHVAVFGGAMTEDIDGSSVTVGAARTNVAFGEPTCTGSGIPSSPSWIYTLRDANGDLVVAADDLIGTTAQDFDVHWNGTNGVTQGDTPTTRQFGKAPVKYTIYADWSNAASDAAHVPISYAFTVTSVNTPHTLEDSVHAVAESATSLYVEWKGDGSTQVVDDPSTSTDESVPDTSATRYEVTATTTNTKCAVEKKTVTVQDPKNGAARANDTTYLEDHRIGATVSGLCAGTSYKVTVTGVSGSASNYSETRSPAVALATASYPSNAISTKTPVTTDPDTKRFLLSTGETVDLALTDFLEPILGLAGTTASPPDSTNPKLLEDVASDTLTASSVDAYRYGVDYRFESNLRFDGSVVAGALIDDADMTYVNDIVRLEGAGEGRWTVTLTATLTKKTTATETSYTVPMMTELSASLNVLVLENATPVFKMSDATVDWDIDNVGTDFQINVLADFVKDPVTDDDAGNCTDANQNASNDVNCEHSLKFKVSGASVLEITDDNESKGIITVRKKGDGSYVDLTSVEDGHQYELTVTATDDNGAKDTMTIFVDIIEGNDDPMKRDKATDVWLKPQAEANGGGSDSVGLGSKFYDIESDDLCYQISGTSLTGTTSGGESVTFAEASLAGASACPTDRLTMSMILPSTDPKQENAFKLLGRYGTETVWAEVRAWQRGASPKKYTGSVRVSMELSYGPNASPTIRTVAQATKKNAHHEAGAYVTSGTYEIDEGQDITLTFTADDPQPSGDELCWSSWGSCRPCMGEEDTKRNTKGEITTPRRSSTKATMGAVSQEWEMTIVGTKVVRDPWTGKTKTTVFTDYESRGGVYRLSICATDLAGETDVLSFNVKINDVEEAPTIDDIDDVYTLIGDYAVEVNVASKTKDGDKDETLEYDAYCIGTCQGFKIVEETEGIFNIEPNASGDLGTADELDSKTTEVEVSATDSTGKVAYKRFDVTVKDGNNAPMFGDGIAGVSYTVAENTRGRNVGAPIKVSDADEGDALSTVVSGGSKQFTASIAKYNNNTPDDADDDYMAVQLKVAGTAKLNYEAMVNSYDLVVVVNDEYGGTADIDVRVDVTDVNEKPTVTEDKIDDQRVLVGITLCPIKADDHFDDPDARDKQAGLFIEASTTRPGDATVSVVDNNDICVTGISVGNGLGRVKITATDRDDLSVSKSFRLNVEPNGKPEVVGDGVPDMTAQEGGRTDEDINLDDYFDDGDPTYSEMLSYEFSIDNPGVATGVLIGDNMLRVYGDQKGTATITVTATDQNDQSVSDDFMIEIQRNDPPVAHADAIDDVETRIGIQEDPIDATGAFTDKGDTLTYAVATSDPDIATTALKYDDDGGPWIVVHSWMPGTTKATLTATDSGMNTASVSFTIEVGARNDPPMVANAIDDVTVVVDDREDVELDDVFDDEGSVDITVENEDEMIADVVYRASVNEIRIYANEPGTTMVTVTATDNIGQTAVDEFDVTVEAKPEAVGTIADVTLQIGGEDFDLDVGEYFNHAGGDTLSYTVSTTGSAATITNVGSDLLLSPYTRGTTEVTVTATDSKGRTATQSFSTHVSDSELRMVAENALAGYGRAMLSSVSSTIGARLESDRSDRGVAIGQFAFANEGGYASGTEFSANSGTLGFSFEQEGSQAGRTMEFGVNSFINHRNFSQMLNGQGGVGSWSVWSTQDMRHFAGEGYSGNASSTFMGVDLLANDSWLVGVTASRNLSESKYSWGTATQEMQTRMLSVMPYFNFEPSANTTVWGVLGRGAGDLSSTVVNAASQSSDLAMDLGILGGRHQFARIGGMELAVRGDAGFARLATASGDGAVDSLGANVHRVRAGLESSLAIDLSNGRSIKPFGEIAVRNDGGDGLVGSGIEVGGGVRVETNALTIEARGHKTATHSAADFSESGFTLHAEYNPATDGSGLTFSLAPSWTQTSGAGESMDIWSNASASATTGLSSMPYDDLLLSQSGMTLDATFGYGIRVGSDRFMVKPFVEIQSDAYDNGSTLIGFELQQLVQSSRNVDVRFAAGQSQFDSSKQIEATARIQF